MRFQMWRMAAAAVAGVAILVSAATAQQPVKPVPVAPAPAAQPMPLPAAAPTPAPIYAPPQAYAPAAGPCATGGCATGNCGAMSTKQKLCDKFFIGAGTANPVGCSCWAAERTFFFGSCKQFFTPGKTCCGEPTLYNGCGGYCGGMFAGRKSCPLPPYAAPYGQPANNCAGPFSYFDR